MNTNIIDKKANRLFKISGISMILFLLVLLAVKFIDVRAVGPNGSEIGLAGINKGIFNLLGTSDFWYNVTDIFGYIAILTVAVFGLLGLSQLIKGKSLKKVDSDILLLGGFYAVVLAFYALFEVVIINYRPVLVEGVLEASFPSSHTMMVTCFLGATIYQALNRVNKSILCDIIVFVCAFIIFVTIGGRLLSGVHWFTDILGGVFLSIALIFAYMGVCLKVRGRELK